VTQKPVTKTRISLAREYGISNALAAATVCRDVGIPYFAALALLQKESMGRNVFGHDVGGALAGYPGQVSEASFDIFHWMITTKGMPSNGVGPCQITYKPYFAEMEKKGLEVWTPIDNMTFGFGILSANYDRTKSWQQAAAMYNGGPRPNADALRYGGPSSAS
jgi:hypothetical protein